MLSDGSVRGVTGQDVPQTSVERQMSHEERGHARELRQRLEKLLNSHIPLNLATAVGSQVTSEKSGYGGCEGTGGHHELHKLIKCPDETGKV